MRPRLKAIRDNVLCLALLVLLAVVALYPMFTADKVPFNVNGIFFSPPWEEARPQGLAAPETPELSPQALRYYPWYAFLSHAARARQLPLWNPLEGCGVPFLAALRTRCLSPFSVPFYFLPPGRSLQISIFLKLVIAGWCAFYAARRFGLGAPLALCVGAAFKLSGHVYLWSGHPISDVLPWLPLWLLVVDRLARGYVRHWPLGAVVVALMAVGGDPKMCGAAAFFGLLYLLIECLFSRRRPGQVGASVGAFLLSGIVGTALAAVQIVPYLEFLREGACSGDASANASLELRHMALLFLPRLLSGAAENGESTLKLFHVGVFQLWMLGLWFSLRSFVPAVQRRRVEAMLVAACVMTALAMVRHSILPHVPYVKFLGVERLSVGSVEHLLAGNAFALALLAAMAADAWLALNAYECKAALVRLLVFLPLLGALGVAAVLVCPHASGQEAWPVWQQVLVTVGFLLLLLVLLGVTLVRPSRNIMGFGLALLTTTSLLFAFFGDTAYVDRAAVFPDTSFTKTLRETGMRVCGGDTLERWPLAGNLIPQVYSPSGIRLKRHKEFFERAQTDTGLLQRTGAPGLLLTKQDIQGPFLWRRAALAVARVFPSGAALFIDRNTKPRAWVAYDEQPAEAEGASRPQASNGPPAQVNVEEPETLFRVKVHVDHSRRGVLVLADAYYPGWRVRVDGQKAEILPVAGLFRGVEVGEGPHDVEFYYAPMSVVWGLGITIVAALIVLVKMRGVQRVDATL